MSDVQERKMEKNLELLYDYTKFHIGTYTTLATLYIGIANAKLPGICVHLNHSFYIIAVSAILVAGLSGGTIVSSITRSKALDSAAFLGEYIGPWVPWVRTRLIFTAITWTRVEHISFWIAVLAAIVSIGGTDSTAACSR
ncbi:hypothetical protein AB4Y44_39830 [Paraburkholderia sp. BR10937]|uniref:hypothetical protein n=1 Tax=Paraburkholderia sp. BR10937 TaxID=3236994 RepID=UPI0034D253FB